MSACTSVTCAARQPTACTACQRLAPSRHAPKSRFRSPAQRCARVAPRQPRQPDGDACTDRAAPRARGACWRRTASGHSCCSCSRRRRRLLPAGSRVASGASASATTSASPGAVSGGNDQRKTAAVARTCARRAATRLRANVRATHLQTDEAAVRDALPLRAAGAQRWPHSPVAVPVFAVGIAGDALLPASAAVRDCERRAMPRRQQSQLRRVAHAGHASRTLVRVQPVLRGRVLQFDDATAGHKQLSVLSRSGA